MNRSYPHYAVARLDGALLYREVLAGLTKNGLVKLPVINFKVVAGQQSHPVWAFDDLAEEIFAYCQAAQQAAVSETHLQISLVGTWASAEYFSNIVAKNIEWHVASSALRAEAERIYCSFKNGRKPSWPQKMLLLPVANTDLPGIWRSQ